ncbi:MAG: HlyD family efflux transporter periplasmic adaptor subunit [Gemmatales bacterium]
MSYRSGILTGLLLAMLLGGGVVAAWWLWNNKTIDIKKSAPPPIPATISKVLKEDQLNSVTLTAEAEKLLALQTAPVEKKKLRRHRVYGGEVMIPVGDTIIVSAPFSGVLQAASNAMPVPGKMVQQDDVLFELLPLLTPEGRANLATAKVDTDGQLKNAETQLEAVIIVLNRAKQLLQNGAGSVRQVDEAQAQVDLARKVLEAAKARRDLLSKVMGEFDRGTAAAIVIRAPARGMIRNISARPGQSVPTGAPLFELFDPSRMWVRVPVYVGDLKELDTRAAVTVGTLEMKPGSGGLTATPVAAPPSANAVAGTVDLFYKLDNIGVQYSPAHRVGVTIDLNDDAESLAVPWAAVVHDVYGGSWVYIKTAEHTFVRHRVIVRFVKDNLAALIQGPAAGSQVVTAGAAELFGTETGFSK